MQNALLRIVEAEIPHPISVGVAVEPLQHPAHRQILYPASPCLRVAGRHVMICAGDHLLRPEHGAPGRFEIVEGVACALVQQQVVHIEQALAFHLRHLVASPDLLHQRATATGSPAIFASLFYLFDVCRVGNAPRQCLNQ